LARTTLPLPPDILIVPDDDDVYFIELQHVGYKNLYLYRPAKTAEVQNEIKKADK
jgi:hypothetical protein